MRRTRLGEYWMVAMPLAASILLSVGGAAALPGDQSRAATSLTGNVTYSPYSLPQSGVRLLEDILQRVRSVPQLAMAKNRLQSLGEVQQGPTDYRLAIKPREVQWPQKTNQRLSTIASNLPDKESVNLKSAAKPRGFWEKDKGIDLVDADRKKSDIIAFSPAQESRSNLRGGELERGIWERDEAKNQMSPSSQQSLGQAAGKLYNLSRQLNQLSQLNEGVSGGYGGGGGGGAGSGGGTNVVRGGRLDYAPYPSARSESNKAERVRADDSLKRRSQRAAGEPEAKTRGVEEFTYGQREAKNTRSLYPTPTPSVAAAPVAPPPVTGSAFDDSGAAGSQLADGSFQGQKIALLPPNVVTGIPMVRLGISQSQAARTLAAVGSMSQQRSNGWTIWSYSKPGTRAPALQVFMRYGQVEALRIFDTSLVGADFGVQLGDNLAGVKQRFGEPAFILSEPKPGAGQNYVYPISQVAFLMARKAPSADPQVVSMLIFNVR